MQLLMAKKGEEWKIFKLIVRDEDKKRLEHLGFLCGETVKVISNANEIFVLEVKGARLAIDEMTASKILVH